MRADGGALSYVDGFRWPRAKHGDSSRKLARRASRSHPRMARTRRPSLRKGIPSRDMTAPGTASTPRKRFAGFLVANVLQRLGQVFLLLMLTRLANTTDVSGLGLFTSFFAIVVPFASQNVHQAFGRLFFDVEDPGERRNLGSALLGTAMAGSLLGSVLAVGVLIGQLHAVGVEESGRLGILAVVGCTIMVPSQFFHVLLRVQDRVRAFVLHNLILGLGLPLAFVALGTATGFTLSTAALSYVASHLLASLVSAALCREALTLRFRLTWPMFRAGLAVGSGAMAYHLSQWVSNYAGRWIGASSMTPDALALYTLITQLCAVITIFYTTIFEAYRLPLLQAFSRRDYVAAWSVLARPTRYACVATPAIYVLFALLAPISPRLLGPAYEIDSATIFLSFGISFSVVWVIRSFWLGMGLIRMTLFGVLAAGAAVVTVVLAIVLAPVWQLHGLLVASLVGTAALAFMGNLVFTLTQRGTTP